MRPLHRRPFHAREFSAGTRFHACFEGGFANHPKDPGGGATMKGVTLKTFQRYKPGAGE